MKRNFVVSTLVSLSVSLAVILGAQLFAPDTVEIKHVAPHHGGKVLYAMNSDGEVTPLDFTKTTDKILDAVVHIKSIRNGYQGADYQYRDLPDPFKNFFKSNPFGEFFERRFYNVPPGSDGENQATPKPVIGTGSGVIINENGYIITNHHVIEHANDIEVTLHNNGTYKASLVGTDPSTDLALLQIKAENLKPLSFVNSDDVQVGEWVLAVGNPFSLNSTVTAGIVSAKARNININRNEFAVESFIQTDAAINPGNSGGALVNLNGDLIGINTAIASRTGTYNGYGFAVPSNIVSKVVEDLLEYGTVQRGVLGISIRTLDGNLAKEEGIDVTQGVFIGGVTQDSAAEKAGIKPGDVIAGIDGKPIKTAPELQELIARKRPGDKVTVKVWREGEEKTLSVTLENRNGTIQRGNKEHHAVLNTLGAELETVSENVAKDLNIHGGVIVTKLYYGKLQNQTRINEGFIITHVNGKKVSSVDDLIKSLKDKEEGGVMLEGVYEDLPGKHYYAFGVSPN